MQHFTFIASSTVSQPLPTAWAALSCAEVLEAVQLAGQGFTLRARCTSEGVPFASCFANHVQVGDQCWSSGVGC